MPGIDVIACLIIIVISGVVIGGEVNVLVMHMRTGESVESLSTGLILDMPYLIAILVLSLVAVGVCMWIIWNPPMFS